MTTAKINVGDLVQLTGTGWVTYCDGHYYNKLYLVVAVGSSSCSLGDFIDEDGELEDFDNDHYSTKILSKVYNNE